MKKFLTLTLISIIVAGLGGCSGGAIKTNTTPETKQTVAEEKKTDKAVTYKDGTYQGVGQGMHEIKVSVQVTGGKIAKVEITQHDETKGVAESALEQIPAAIVKKNSPDVDVVSGATKASEGIIEAVKNALEKAK